MKRTHTNVHPSRMDVPTSTTLLTPEKGSRDGVSGEGLLVAFGSDSFLAFRERRVCQEGWKRNASTEISPILWRCADRRMV
ncbi:hypothetical protein HZH66_009565 [Vespula vulgaris]|uniref:Uncharacterized protein n=2 Tax=Vespula TaxID=7451 RepID=A0A834N098_VESVU|nr:hypothetical protein HZH66_009565 [Vespula vulgaris]